MKKYYTEAEEARQDHNRGRYRDAKARLKALMAKRTREAPHELIIMFRLFGNHQNISESDMLKLMYEITTIRSRKLVQNVFSDAANHWRAFLDDREGGEKA